MAGRRLKPEGEPVPVLGNDLRVEALQAVRSREPTQPEEFVSEIQRLWGRAQQSFLDIGRLLIRAKDILPHGSYLDAVESQLPFSSRTAYQLREAARWALAGTYPPEQLPGSYATIYTLSTLDPPLLQAADQEGMIRPDLTRAQIMQWKKRKAAPLADQEAALTQRAARLRREAARIADELAKVEEELSKLGRGRPR